jgi:PAS domain S-box-containing protein
MEKNTTKTEDSSREMASLLKMLQKMTKAVYSSFDLGKIFNQIAEETLQTMGYTTVFIMAYNDTKDCHEIKALSMKKGLLSQINKIIGFSLKDYGITLRPDLNATVNAVSNGKIVVSQSLEEVVYPVISKRMCRALQRLNRTKNYIVVPLDVKNDLAGAVFISSGKDVISEHELEILKSFKNIASNAISNAKLLSETKVMKESLEKEKAYLDQLLESSPEAVVTTDTSGNVVRVNSEFTRMFGYAKKEAAGRSIDDLVSSGDLYEEALSITEIVGKGEKYAVETKRCCKNGKIIDVSLLGSPIKAGGKQVGSYAIYRDISKRKNAEREIKESEMIHRALFKYANDAVFLMDLEGNHVDANKKAADMLGYERKELLGKSFKDIVASSDLSDATSKLNGLLENESFPMYERFFVKKDGTKFPVEINVSLIRDSQNKPRLIQSIVRDVTERKGAEEKIKASLKEKEVMLKEIHHRVKNNMQIISSLINLQASGIKDKETEMMLKSSQNRIKSMAIIHERLYQSEDFTRVDLNEYVRSLTSHLLLTYGVDRKKVRFHTEIKDIFLDINRAVPCGLIINELLTNSLKHAFPNGKKGNIKIAVHHLEDQKTELLVSDNGVGIPEDMDVRKTDSLGMTLVKILSEDQLKGSLRLDKTKGTCFRIIF